mgnify:CR=1 FL=1
MTAHFHSTLRLPRNEFRVCYVKLAEAISQTTRFSAENYRTLIFAD